MKAVIRVVDEFVEELQACFFQQLFECHQISRTEAATFATAQKCVYMLTTCRRGMQYLRHNYRLEDGLETDGIQAVTA